MLVETGGVRDFTPGRSNLVAVREGEQAKSSVRHASSVSKGSETQVFARQHRFR